VSADLRSPSSAIFPVGGFLLLQIFLQQVGAVIAAELLRPADQRSVSCDLAVFDRLTGRGERRIQHLLVRDLPGDLLRFLDDAVDVRVERKTSPNGRPRPVLLRQSSFSEAKRNRARDEQVVLTTRFSGAKEAFMHRSLALGLLVSLAGLSAWADRAPTDEERIAPLVTVQGCWGGVIKFLADDSKFDMDQSVCSDGRICHLEFDADLKLVAKRMVR
jgi:hypothetical protein